MTRHERERAHRIERAVYRRRSHQAAARPNQLVPQNTVSGRALTVVIAIMSFLACLTLGAVSLVRDASRDWQLDAQREVTVQVRPIDGVDLEHEAAEAASIARRTAGVASVAVLDAKENAALLEPWLGAGLDLSDLPIPRLIVVRLSDPAGADLAGLADRLQNNVRGASLDDHRTWARRLRSVANATLFAGIGILGLVFVATVLSVIFATRGAMATNQVVVSVLHICGAEDGYIAREFQRHFLILGLRGGLTGAVLAGVLFAVLGLVVAPALTGNGEQVSILFGRFAIGPIGYFGALGIAFLIAIMTALTSRLTVYQHLANVD